jgi:hypothetical protein
MLVPDWKRAWRWFTVQLHAAALSYLALYSIMPALDPSIAKLLPTPFQAPAIGIYALLGIVLRLIAQKRPDG